MPSISLRRPLRTDRCRLGPHTRDQGEAMSVENVEAVRAAYEAFGSGDLEGVGKQFADNVEWESPDTLPTGGVFRGRDAVLASFAEIPKYWSKFSVDPDEYIDAGDHVVVRGVQSVHRARRINAVALSAPLHPQ